MRKDRGVGGLFTYAFDLESSYIAKGQIFIGIIAIDRQFITREQLYGKAINPKELWLTLLNKSFVEELDRLDKLSLKFWNELMEEQKENYELRLYLQDLSREGLILTRTGKANILEQFAKTSVWEIPNRTITNGHIKILNKFGIVHVLDNPNLDGECRKAMRASTIWIELTDIQLKNKFVQADLIIKQGRPYSKACYTHFVEKIDLLNLPTIISKII